MQSKKYDVVALGELLIDFSYYSKSEKGENLYEQNAGGAPCNVLSMLANCDKKTAFIGKVGADMFGQALKKTIESIGIDSSGLKMAKDVNTTLAFVQIDDKGERNFSFYRNPGADMTLSENEVPKDIIQNSIMFHFGSLSMTHDIVKNATIKAIDLAKEAGCLISFDPNIRFPLWQNEDDLLLAMRYGCSKCDILKISDDELEWMSGLSSMDEGVAVLKKEFPITLILVTAGTGGSYAYHKDFKVYRPAFLNEKTIDTTGAGDAFLGACLSYLLDKELSDLKEPDLFDMLSFANKAASIITTKKGALKVMPKRAEILF